MPDGLKQALGSSIRAARVGQRITQDKLAEAIGRSPEGISNIERGLSLPALDTLIEIAQALKVEIGDLLGDLSIRHDISVPRALLFARLREAGRELSDSDLAIGVRQFEVIAEMRGRTAKKA